MGEGFHQFDGFVEPVDDEVARDVDSRALEDSFLTVNGQVVDVIANKQVGEEGGAWQASEQRGDGRGGDDGWKVALALAPVFRPHDEAADKAGGDIVWLFGGFRADALVGFGIGGDQVGDDFLGLDGELVEASDAGAVAAALLQSGAGLIFV